MGYSKIMEYSMPYVWSFRTICPRILLHTGVCQKFTKIPGKTSLRLLAEQERERTNINIAFLGKKYYYYL